MLPMLGIHLYETFTVLRLKSFLSGFPGGKEVSIILKNCLPTLVFTSEFQGGLHHVILHAWFFLFHGIGWSWVGVKVRVWLWPLYVKASWYGVVCSYDNNYQQDKHLDVLSPSNKLTGFLGHFG